MTENTTASGAADLLRELLQLVEAQREYIHAIPDSAFATFPAMPGFDRDWADELVVHAKALAASAPVAPAPQPPAGLLSVGVRVKVLPNVTRYNQKPWVGKVGTIHALCGQHDWDVCFAGKPGYWDSFMRFDPSELEVCQDAQPAPLQQGEYLPLAVASAPDRIWLDLGFDPKETDADFSDLNTPTWSADNASGHGIEYVRADRAARGAAQVAPAPVAEDAERWREFQKGKPLVVKMAKSTVIYGPNHEREFPDALNKAVDHARAQAAQPEGGVNGPQ